jgi:malonyl-CoA/methylmalonyl-CoA synthetase
VSDAAASVVEAFCAHAERTPEKLCLLFEKQPRSYGQLRDRAMVFAAALRGWGLRPGDRVALFLANGPDFVAAYLGIQLAGGIVVLINTQYRQVELRHMLRDADVRLCFTDAERSPALDQVRPALPELAAVITLGPALDAFLAGAAQSLDSLPMPAADDVAIIAYTSGTTGRSKGAVLLQRNLIANIRAVCAAWRWTAADHLLLTLPLFHAHGLMVGLHGTIVTGASAELHRSFDAPTVYERLLHAPVTMFFGVPTMYTRLLSEAVQRSERPPQLRLYVSGSAPLSPQTFAAFAAAFGQPILERYGMTETIMNTTNPYDGERRPGTVGMAFPGQEARVVDLHSRAPLPSDAIGEIEVRGPHVCRGYWQRPDATAESFTPDGWFRTGDLGSFSADGYLTISGRAKELIISGGFNVYPREVEEVLEAFPGVAEVAVIGLPDADLGEQVTAVVVAAGDVSAAELIAFCQQHLASFKKPRQVIFWDALPRNALGKIEKQTIRSRLIGDR